MKIIVVHSPHDKHQEEIDKALEAFSFKNSPWRITSVSTSSIIHSHLSISFTTVIALNDESRKGGK
jgi:hypothetical protein